MTGRFECAARLPLQCPDRVTSPANGCKWAIRPVRIRHGEMAGPGVVTVRRDMELERFHWPGIGPLRCHEETDGGK